MQTAVKCAPETLATIAQAAEGIAALEDVEAEYANASGTRYCILNFVGLDGATYPWCWLPEDIFAREFEFVGTESDTEFVEVIRKV